MVRADSSFASTTITYQQIDKIVAFGGFLTPKHCTHIAGWY